MHLETLDYITVKNEREQYKGKHNGDKGKNFDEAFLGFLEQKYGMRIFNIKHNNGNVTMSVYLKDTNGSKSRTSTVSIIDVMEHETLIKFAHNAGKYAADRARLKPSSIDDDLTRAARNQICNPNDVFQNVANLNRALKPYTV
jgi:hypothetical protein